MWTRCTFSSTHTNVSCGPRTKWVERRSTGSRQAEASRLSSAWSSSGSSSAPQTRTGGSRSTTPWQRAMATWQCSWCNWVPTQAQQTASEPRPWTSQTSKCGRTSRGSWDYSDICSTSIITIEKTFVEMGSAGSHPCPTSQKGRMVRFVRRAHYAHMPHFRCSPPSGPSAGGPGICCIGQNQNTASGNRWALCMLP
ncbi:hypothetical protein CLUG_01955 [Clavispora lusitaniae ATCC 42720]|uniref:Uncharacterized protein n=1 Tax=Clavispora lusitaniae (strain ATCC 42720) TaxID=306902 RepID=C4Y173_CLAL4|nr:uncharacterized protein CLUG_01955 [Clavispora lusitaniae ATCC 42720]EEQ37832.1 hypothetical protein CLUG_01955 [Clavispora lusitaniae ATCC 42720]